MKPVHYHFHSLEDFLVSKTLHADGHLDDGWGAAFPVKGREVDATVLFADITAFSTRTLDMSPAESLAFVNNFFAWISAEALRGGHGIIDKYIGDEIMIVYSKEFGSDDPFVEAVQAAGRMARNDALAFCPHIGIASGRVMIGYVGTPLKYNCSTFGAPVAVAARCGSVVPEDSGRYGATVVFPAAEWGARRLEDVLPPERYTFDGETYEQPMDWELRGPRHVTPKGMALEVHELVRTAFSLPSPGSGAEDRVREGVAELKKAGLYRPDLPY
jgi:class 3 adenylate cyclase